MHTQLQPEAVLGGGNEATALCTQYNSAVAGNINDVCMLS
jgi:hypothetical protein